MGLGERLNDGGRSASTVRAKAHRSVDAQERQHVSGGRCVVGEAFLLYGPSSEAHACNDCTYQECGGQQAHGAQEAATDERERGDGGGHIEYPKGWATRGGGPDEDSAGEGGCSDG